MLSRANSDAGARLRRAKSSPSIQHRASGMQNTVVDPRHAEMAAAEAYRRAYKQGDPIYQSQSSAKPNKRRSQMPRKSEGSYFEESRNGNRLGTTRPKGPSRSNSTKRPDPVVRLSEIDTSNDHCEETVITRPRRFINTSTVPSSELSRNGSAAQFRVRKAKSAYYTQPSTGDDTVGSNKSRLSTCYPDTPYRTAIEKVNRGSESEDILTTAHAIARKPSPREMQTDETIKVAAWDAYLQDFHQRKLRERKSFIAPLKKRLTRDILLSDRLRHDSSVPPYNLANDADDVFSSSPVPPSQSIEPLQVEKSRKTRTVSDSLRSKFKRLMGISKQVQDSLPVQHVESQRPHFDAVLTTEEGESGGVSYALSLPPRASSPSSTTRTRKSSAKSSRSNGDAATMRSRVTSWTTSTGTGTVRSSGQGGALSSIDETGMISKAETQPKQNHGSFLGRALRLPLRRNSRADLHRSSEESQHLYDALCKQIQGPEEHTGTTTIDSNIIATDTMVKEYLPPRCQKEDEDAHLLGASTIRAVIPEPEEGFVAVPEPAGPPIRPAPAPPAAIGKPSWLRNARRSLPSQTFLPENDQPGPDGKEQHHPNTGLPSQEQIANRLGKSQTRWQSALEDRSPVLSQAMLYNMEDDDPYRLRSIVASPQNEYLPVAIRHNQARGETTAAELPRTVPYLPTAREKMISPSVYSRTTDCRSTTPSGVTENRGTFITVTGREVKRYSLDSPSKLAQQDNFILKPSYEWKTWLNSEFRDFDSSPAPEDFLLNGPVDHLEPKRITDVLPTNSGPYAMPSERLNSRNALLDSKEDLAHGSEIRASRTRRPTLRTRRSSMMNERYPLIEGGRGSSSDRSMKAKTRSSSRQASYTSRVVSTAAAASSRELPQDVDLNPALLQTETRPQIRERHSVAVLGSSPNQLSSVPIKDASISAEEQDRIVVSKPKSALELRAVYRNTRNNGNGSINIRRKATSAIVQEDDTLRKISHGPYGQASPANKENAAPSPSSCTIGEKKLARQDQSAAPSPSRLVNLRARPSRASMPRSTPGIAAGKGQGSPSQRMVDDFLSSRKLNAGSSPAAGNEGSFPAFI